MTHENISFRGQPNVMPFVIAGLGLVFAIFLGFLIGDHDTFLFVLVVMTIGGLAFATFFYRFVWQTSLFFVFLAFGYRLWFKFGPEELTSALAFGAIALFIWQKRAVIMPEILVTSRSFVFMQKAILTWVIFSALHFYFNYKMPYRPGDFSFGNGIKPYFFVSAPLFVLYYFSRNPTSLLVKPNFLWRIAQLCLAGVILNLFVRAWDFAGLPSINIPIINGAPNGTAFRELGPFAMVLGTICLTSKELSRQSGMRWLTYLALILLGTIGSLFSGGRATIVAGFILIACVFVLRKRFGLLIGTLLTGVVICALLNIFSHFIYAHTNEEVQRSLQWVLLEKDWSAKESIDSSSEWRRELAHRAIEDWTSSPRTFWLGRATYGFGLDDVEEISRKGGFEALLDISLRRGATHNLLTDLLVAYGLIGCITFIIAYLSIVVFLWHIYRASVLRPAATDLALLCLLIGGFNLVFEMMGGGNLRIELYWCVIVLLVALYKGVGLRERDASVAQPLPSAARLSADPAVLRS